jgi:HlyD family secretion protein
MKRVGRALALFAALAAAVAAACGDDLSDLPAVGTLERERVDLVAEASEPIVEIAVREGDRVEAGALLVRLDERRLAAEARRAEALAGQARARLAELERGPRAERIAEARARLEGAERGLEVRGREYARAAALAERAVESEANLDLLRGRRDEAQALRDQARAALDELLEGTTDEELDQARSALAAAEAALAEARVRLERLAVRAPRPGVIDALPFELGDRPPAGATLATLLAEGAPYARVYVPAPLRARLSPGAAAEVRVEGRSETYRGRLRSLSHDPAFTPYFALTERDRSRLAYVAEVDLVEAAAAELPSGVPVEARFPPEALARSREETPKRVE